MDLVYEVSSHQGMVNVRFFIECERDRIVKIYDDGYMSSGRIVYFIIEQKGKFWLHRESTDSQEGRIAGESQALEVTTKEKALRALVDRVVEPYKSNTTWSVDPTTLERNLQEALLA